MARVIYLGGLYGAVGSWMARAAAEAVLDAGNTPACRRAAVLVPELCANGPVELAQGTGKPV